MHTELIATVRETVRKGTGEAILLLQQHPDLDCADVLIHASIHNLAYDPQCENSRELYLYELIQLSTACKSIEETLIQNVAVSTDDDWGIFQLFGIVSLFAKNGNEKARAVIYQRYKENTNPDFPFVDTYTPIDLDGYEGLKFIAEIRGKMLLANPEDWEDEYILQYSQEALPDVDVKKQLLADAADNVFIHTFLESIERQQRKVPNQRKHDDYQSITELITAGKQVPFSAGKKLGPPDLVALANDLLQEHSEASIASYLRIFSSAAFPLDWRLLLGFLTHSNRDITIRAIWALTFFCSEELRKIALTQLTLPEPTIEYLNLLIENYEEEDHVLLLKLLGELDDEQQVHDAGNTVIRIYRKHPTHTCLGPLQKLYQKGNCGICREDVIEILLQVGNLPDYMKAEAIHDSYLATRKRMQAII